MPILVDFGQRTIVNFHERSAVYDNLLRGTTYLYTPKSLRKPDQLLLPTYLIKIPGDKTALAQSLARDYVYICIQTPLDDDVSEKLAFALETLLENGRLISQTELVVEDYLEKTPIPPPKRYEAVFQAPSQPLLARSYSNLQPVKVVEHLFKTLSEPSHLSNKETEWTLTLKQIVATVPVLESKIKAQDKAINELKSEVADLKTALAKMTENAVIRHLSLNIEEEMKLDLVKGMDPLKAAPFIYSFSKSFNMEAIATRSLKSFYEDLGANVSLSLNSWLENNDFNSMLNALKDMKMFNSTAHPRTFKNQPLTLEIANELVDAADCSKRSKILFKKAIAEFNRRKKGQNLLQGY